VFDAFAWPVTVILLGFGFMIIFRKPIAALVDRTKRVGKSGLETFESPQLPAPSDKPNPLAEFLGTYDNPLLRHSESLIEAELKQRGLTDPAPARKALLRSLAGSQILLHFEQIQGLIWASQLTALGYLNSRAGPVGVADLQSFYDDARERYPALYHSYNFEQWIGFLKSWMLVDKVDAGFSITMVGREFLKWRVDSGKAGPFYG
jgi:hypothetical protein